LANRFGTIYEVRDDAGIDAADPQFGCDAMADFAGTSQKS
jgi:hypothetical protein